MPIIELAGERQASYEVVGEGAPTLMFPGGPGFAAAYMRPNAELFANRLRSFLIDPHGSGDSTPPASAADYSPEGHARFYDEVRQALGLERVAVFGHSFGATTALTYSALFGEMVERCIAVAAFGMGTDVDDAEGGGAAAEMEAAVKRHAGASWFGKAKRTLDEWTDRVLTTNDANEVSEMMATVLPLYTAHPDEPRVAKALWDFRKHLKADLAAAKAWEGGLYQSIDLRPIVGRIDRPTLLVAGEEDFICGPAQVRPLADAITTSTLILLDDCGHIPVVEVPDAFHDAIVDWIEG